MADYNEDYYNLLKQQNYEALLNKEVQLDNARQRALKFTNSNLAAQGLQSSGYGQTATSGIESQYLSAMEGVNKGFQEEQNRLSQEQQQAYDNSQYNNYAKIASALSELDNLDDVSHLMETYGLYTDGKFDYDKAISQYGDQNALDLRYLYETKLRGFEQPNKEFNYNNGKGVTISYYDRNGKTDSITLKGGQENGWNKENKTLQSAINTNSLANDSYVALTNKHGNTIYLRYNGGKLYYVNKEQYEKSSNKYYIVTGHGLQKGSVQQVFDALPKLPDGSYFGEIN